MIRKRYHKRSKFCYLVFFILIFNIISIFFLPISDIKELNYENSMDSPESLIQSSSSSLPNKHYFKYYKVISIDHTKVSGTSSHNNFPVLISIFDSDLHDDVQSTGNDIAFAKNTEWLDHEIESFEQEFNSTHAKLVAWVRVPSLSTSFDTIIYLYYGNATMSSRENPTGVWDTNYKGVWHLSEDPPGTIYDSTSNNHDGTTQGSMNSGDQIDGQIDGCLNFDGNDEYVDFGNPTELQITGAITVEGWFKADYYGNTYLISKNGPSHQRGWDISFDPKNLTHGYLIYRYARNGEIHADDVGNVTITINQWYHVVGVFEPSIYSRMFLNGQKVDENATGIISSQYDAPNPVRFATRGDEPPPNYYNGTLDEVRISNIARSADWIKTEYDNQFDPNSFYSIGKEYSVSDHPPEAQHFLYYKEITIDHTLVSGPDDLLNFPLLFSCFDEDLHDNVQPDGDDIAFSDSTSWFEHEIELFNKAYNSTHAQLVAWVRIPKLSTSVDTIIRMYYGNSTLGSRENPEGVWDSNYKGVWHLSEDPTDSSPAFKDSTPNNNDGTDYGSMTSGDQVPGQIDGSLDFDGGDDYLEANDSSSLTILGSFTVSAWINTNDLPPVGDLRSVVGKGMSSDDPGENHNYGIMLENKILTAGQAIEVYYEPSTGFSNVVAASWVTSLSLGQWYHVVGVHDAGADTLTLFVNGVQRAQNTGATATPDTGNAPLRIADVNVDIYPNKFNGQIDEVRISDKARSGDWINTEFDNQNNPNSFYSIGKEYPLSGIPPNEHYFKYYKEIIIDHKKVSGSHDLFNFPLLISTFDEDLHDKAQGDGDDIAFAYNGAWLNHEIELFSQNFNSSHAQLIAWVSIPRLSTSSDTTIRMYYGNATISDQQNPTAVWGKNYRGVWHLSEISGNSMDSTTHGTEGIPSTGVTQGVSGLIGNAYDFDGISGTKLDYGDPVDDHLDVGTSSFTVSVWIKIDQNTGTFQMPLYKGGTSSGNVGYTLEVNNGMTSSFYVSNGTQASSVGWPSITLDAWKFLVGVVNRTSGKMIIYRDGSFYNDANVVFGNLSSDKNLLVSNNFYPVDGIIDEPRICAVARSSDWIATEYNNQFNPKSFLTVAEEVSFDITPPKYSNPTESSDPLELGETEVITINVSDPSGIKQVKIEYSGSNHSMTNIGDDTWQYDSWTPTSVNNYTYTIWIEDNYHNWNFTIGTIEVIDTISPTYSDLIESADPLQLGQNETITIKVYDSPGSGVNQVLLEYGSSNHTMIFMGGNTWMWSNWNASLGPHSYTIYMQDMENNWNMTSGTIMVVSTTAPTLENLTESEDPLELGNYITIGIDVYDNESSVDVVLIEIEGTNHTMINTIGFRYEFNYTISYVGTFYYTIYTNDTDNNWNSLTNSFDIVDTISPTFSNPIKSEDPLEFGETVVISVNSTDLSDINQVKIEFEGGNHSMTNIGGNEWQYNLWNPSATGNWSYTVWAEDSNGNWGFITDSFIVRDTILPKYSDLTESESIVELGDLLTISINATDLAGVKEVLMEFENSNHSMINIGGNIWRFNSWGPNSIGNYTYTIYITDINNNLNSTTGSILFQDTILPTYSNFFESVDPLELGDTVIIRIDNYDYAGINQSLIEIEGANHSMTNIYGDTWQYDSWIPNNWILYQYKIYIEDMSGNWNSMTANITVQDTLPPLPPVFTNNPVGEVSGIIVFDWLDGSDPSGISYYILIIDNEIDPLTTPGYVYFFNITNVGPESSYFILPQNLTIGDYFYFLAQIDGVGHQSSYTIGAFTIIQTGDGEPGNNNLITIMIILASVVGSLIAIVIVRKRLKKDMKPKRKKIALKIISSHISKISSPQPVNQAIEFQDMIFDDTQDQSLFGKELTNEQELETRINEIKNMGEQLFTEGAYLEAQKQFKLGRDLLINLEREDEAKIFSELIAGIEGLLEERDKRLELLDQSKSEGDSVQVFQVYQDLMDISKKLRDSDSSSYYQSELIDYFQKNSLKLENLEKYRFELNQNAEVSYSNNFFEEAATLYDKCERISQLLVQLEREEEIAKIEEFRYKKNECLKKINNN
ncbi:MAG: DUF2341 domain-containing protein [Promethearchaeota archaeon]